MYFRSVWLRPLNRFKEFFSSVSSFGERLSASVQCVVYCVSHVL